MRYMIMEKRNTMYLHVMVMIGLLILRFPFIIFTSIFPTVISNNISLSIFTDGTYILTAILIFLEKNRLQKFNINLFAIIIFILFPMIKPIIYVVTADYVPWKMIPFSKVQILVSIILCLTILKSHTEIKRENLVYYVKWSIISVLIGIFTAIALGYFYKPFVTRGEIHASVPIFIFNFITQLTNAAISEEPLFRGFIWGYLDGAGWKSIWIWLFQAIIFSIGHIYYLPKYPVFFIGTFIGALIFGAIAWRSKSIGTSIVVHGTVNSLLDLINHFTW